ncbi:hypothetical protein C8R43DRAFT_909506 [Mycena crocata]|nr:hypothetical protein C8R43DRAFT_909506 [Mycena crocata]
MQTVTGTILSGSAIPRLSFPRQPQTAFTPNDLDLYTPHGSWRYTLEFFRIGTPYRFFTHLPDTYGLPSVDSITWLTSHIDNPRAINIMRCRGNHPQEPVVQFHSTCVMGSVDADGAWFANPQLLVDGITVMNRLHFRLDTVAARQTALGVLRKYTDRGFQFAMDFDSPHICGVHKSCPATTRMTTDDGCLFVRFPRPAFATDTGLDNYAKYPDPYILSWSNGGMGCKKQESVVIPAYDPHCKFFLLKFFYDC